MSWRNVGVVYRKELTDSLRDRRTVISMIVVPILLMPMFTVGIGVVSALLFGRAMLEVPTVMVLGGEQSPGVLAALRADREVKVVPARPDYAQEISDKQIRAAVKIPADFDAAVARGDAATVRIYMYQGELKSGFGAERLQKFFLDYRARVIQKRLVSRNLPADLARPFSIDQENVAPPEKVGGALIGGLVPYFVILLCLTGAMYPAIDLTAGEKERGTIETILCSPVSRVHLVLGKFFMVLTASLFTGLLAILSMGLTFAAGKKILESLEPVNDWGLSIAISAKAVIWVFLMIVPLAVLLSAALLAIALFAKSYKEAQSYLSPLTVFVILPAVVSVLPGVELNAGLALIPVLNTSLISKEIVAGTYHWNYIALIFASSCVYAAIALAVAIRLFQREDVLFRT
jgi:sodium transport system permease protein